MVISVKDDGRGINAEKVAEKARARGLIGETETVDLARATELLFHPGFSTADTTSDISGRGVGMDAVRVAIRELGGEVTLTSEPGQGTCAEIRLPLTLAIMTALLVHADGRPFAIPLDRIERIVRLHDHPVRSVAGRQMLVLTDGALPIVDAAEQFGGTPCEDAAFAVVVRGNGERMAFAVSATDGQRELVTRPLPPEISDGFRPLRCRRALGRADRPDRRLRRDRRELHPSPRSRRMSATYNDIQLDALRELANIGAGNASTALSGMLGRSVDLRVPDARLLPMHEAVEAIGPPESEITGIALGVLGDLPSIVLMLLTPPDAEALCGMLGLPPDSEYAESALGEIGNVVGTSYLNALAGMTGIEIEPTPPATATDMLASLVQAVLSTRAAFSDSTLLLNSSMVVEDEGCSIIFLLVPDEGGAGQLLERLGVS